MSLDMNKANPPEYKYYKRTTTVNPVQNTYYECINVKNARILTIALSFTDVDETIEGTGTVDGHTIMFMPTALNHSTEYYWLKGGIFKYVADSSYPSTVTLPEGKSISISFRKTTAAGNTTLTVDIEYEQWR